MVCSMSLIRRTSGNLGLFRPLKITGRVAPSLDYSGYVKQKVKAGFLNGAQYPDSWTAKSALNFTPRQTRLF